MATTYDAFTRADSTSLGSTPEGYAWSEVNFSDIVGQHSIVSNAAEHVDSVDGCALIDIVDSNDQAVESVILVVNNTGLTVRADANAQNCYLVFEFGDTTSQLFRRVAAAYTQLGVNQTNIANNDTFKLEASGSTITMSKNGGMLETETDSNITTGTRCGLWSGALSGKRYGDFSATWTASATYVSPRILIPRIAVHRASRW